MDAKATGKLIYELRTITTTRQTGGLLLAYKAKGLKPRLKSHAFTYVQAYCSLSPAGL